MSTDSFIQITPDSNGKKVDNALVTTGSGNVYRQRVEVFPSNEELLVDTGLIQGVTNAELRATPISVNITDGAGIVNSKQLGIQLVTTDIGLITNTIIHGMSTSGGGSYKDVKVTPSGALTVESTISDIVSVKLQNMTYDTSARVRTSQMTTLFDGKHLGVDDTFKWDIVGTGSNSFTNNTMVMSVISGQYMVRQAKHVNPYFSGKPQLIETTYINFQNEANVVKRVGYFSSSNVAPYTANLDGVYIESDGVNSTYRLVCVNNGTDTHNIPWTSWDNYSLISTYDWSKFTVNEIDFLWLGGAGLRLFLILNGVFTLVHTIDNHAGYQANLIMLSPNQPVRYEIRSTTGTGSFTEVCSQVASEGSISEEGEELSVFSGSIPCNAIGTIYAIKGVRKSLTYKNIHVDVENISANVVAATTDSGILMLILNPTLSAPLTWTANSKIEEGTATNQTITAGTGRVLAAIPMNTSGSVTSSLKAGLRSLAIDTAGVAGQLILAYQPTTLNQNVVGSIQVLES